MLDWKFDDARVPNEAERENLSRLIHIAFVDIRALLLDGRAQQAKDLAEAFHNAPLFMYTGNFSFKAFRGFLERYQEKYAGLVRFNYLQEWEKLNASA